MKVLHGIASRPYDAGRRRPRRSATPTFRARSPPGHKPGQPEEPLCRAPHCAPSAAGTHPRAVEIGSSLSPVTFTANRTTRGRRSRGGRSFRVPSPSRATPPARLSDPDGRVRKPSGRRSTLPSAALPSRERFRCDPPLQACAQRWPPRSMNEYSPPRRRNSADNQRCRRSALVHIPARHMDTPNSSMPTPTVKTSMDGPPETA